jgi:hypothetical protein
MIATLLKSLLALVPTLALFAVSALLVRRERTTGSLLQLAGAGCLLIVVLTHVFEALEFLPWMHWGRQHSVGHYLDLLSAVLGLTLLPAGYVLRRLRRRRITRA